MKGRRLLCEREPDHLADDAILSTSSLLPTEYELASPCAAFDISETMPSVNDFLLLAVAEAQPTERLRSAI